jgi:hypothetical protein
LQLQCSFSLSSLPNNYDVEVVGTLRREHRGEPRERAEADKWTIPGTVTTRQLGAGEEESNRWTVNIFMGAY